MLRIEDLSCGYDAKIILKSIDINIKDKELIGIIGPNGSGKTTLLRAISRVLKPASGKILLENKDIWQIKIQELAKKIAVVSQNLSDAIMSVEEFVLLGRIPYLNRFQFFERKEDLRIAENCMRKTDVLKLRSKSMAEISGGERQLALIARALAQQPRLLLLDEPTAHLDITHQVGILDLIKRLNQEFGLTVIMVLHDLNLASQYCDRLVLLRDGLIHNTGTPGEVLTYQAIEEVYKTVVLVKEDPLSSKPHIFLLSQEQRNKQVS